MLFSSLEFLYLFLPLTFATYFLSPARAKNYVLLIASLVFYCAAGLGLLPILLFVALLNYALGLLVKKRADMGKGAKLICALAVSTNALILFTFKYADALLGALGISPIGIELPVGISFYTFQATSYVIDVYRGEARVQKNPFVFVTYVALFPQLVAGPIVRYCEVDSALASRTHSVRLCACGVRLFCVGLSKKLLLANGAGECWERTSTYVRTGETVLGAWLGAVFFALQIYFDFSGYSDMARGLGKIFGFEFPENFCYPYISRSISEFWRRWHITLSTWFRQYVYIPLGGNRRGRARTYLNLLAVWSLTGLWHGAGYNFLLWGTYFFVLITLEKAFLEKYLDRAPKPLAHLYALVFILFGWVIFACDAQSEISVVRYIGCMLCIGCPFTDADVTLELLRNLPFLAVLSIAATPIPLRVAKAIEEKNGRAWRTSAACLSVLSLLLCTAYLADSGYNPFLYFRF